MGRSAGTNEKKKESGFTLSAHRERGGAGAQEEQKRKKAEGLRWNTQRNGWGCSATIRKKEIECGFALKAHKKGMGLKRKNKRKKCWGSRWGHTENDMGLKLERAGATQRLWRGCSARQKEKNKGAGS